MKEQISDREQRQFDIAFHQSSQKLIPQVEYFHIMLRYAVMFNIRNLRVVLKDGINAAWLGFFAVEEEFGQFSYVLSHRHYEYALAMLGDAYVMRAENDWSRRDVIACIAYAFVNHAPCVASVVGGKIANVLQKYVFGMVMIHNPHYVKEKCSLSWVGKPKPLTGYREGLAWKSAAKHIMLRDIGGIHFCNVANGHHPIVAVIRLLTVFINIACENAFAPKRLHSLVESSYTTKEVDEFEVSEHSDMLFSDI